MDSIGLGNSAGFVPHITEFQVRVALRRVNVNIVRVEKFTAQALLQMLLHIADVSSRHVLGGSEPHRYAEVYGRAARNLRRKRPHSPERNRLLNGKAANQGSQSGEKVSAIHAIFRRHSSSFAASRGVGQFQGLRVFHPCPDFLDIFF